jgi:heme/copper-type cytochrome/quinol oxidase subunit 2
MRRVVEIVTEEEYNRWLAEQIPYYTSTIKKEEPAVTEATSVETDTTAAVTGK